MRTSRRQLIAQINNMDKILQYHQLEVSIHKKYIIDTINDYWLVFMIPLLPAFFMLWKKQWRNILKQIVRAGFYIASSGIKRQFFLAHK